MNIEEFENLSQADKAKIFAAWHALAEVKDGMKIGIGTGSTASWFVKLLAGKQSKGLTFRACATSSQTTELAESLGIKIESLDDLAPLGKIESLEDLKFLDLVIDGADEFDPAHNLIKGGGGALLQEKMTARSAKKFIVITDASKAVDALGAFPLPVEVVQFSWRTTYEYIKQAVLLNLFGRIIASASEPIQRMVGNKPFITDEGHYILDLHLKSVAHPNTLDRDLRTIAGVVETGFFLNMANEVIMADYTGLVKSQETGENDWEKTRYELAEIADMLPKK